MPTPTRTERALVDADWLEAHLDDPDLRIIEVDVSPDPHRSGHIPGATLWNIYADLKDPAYRPRPLVDVAAELFARSSIDTDSTVVVYGYAPALGSWLLRLFGHERVAILDADRETWQRQGRPWTDAPSPTGGNGSSPLPDPDRRLRADLRTVLGWIGEPERAIVDVRSHEEYVGERFWPSGGIPDGGRAGRIPTAIHVPADGLQDEHGTFRDVATLRRLLADVPFDRPVVTYCTVGARAATVWFVLTELLGHPDVRVYDGSWTEWGMDPALPIVSGP